MKASNASTQPHHPTWKRYDHTTGPVLYATGECVHYEGYCYRALSSHVAAAPPPDEPYWEQIMFTEHCLASQPPPCVNPHHRVWRNYIAYLSGRCVHHDGFCWEATGAQLLGVTPGPLGWTKLAVVAESKSTPHPFLLPCDAPHPDWSKGPPYLIGHHVHKNGFCWEARRTHQGCNPTPTSISWKATGYSHQGMVTNGCSNLLHPAWDAETYYHPGHYIHYEGVCWRANTDNHAYPPGPLEGANSGVMWEPMTPGGQAVHHQKTSWEVAAVANPLNDEPSWESSVCAEDHSVWHKQVKYGSKWRVHHNLICWESTAGSTGFEPTLHPFQNIWIPRASMPIPVESWEASVCAEAHPAWQADQTYFAGTHVHHDAICYETAIRNIHIEPTVHIPAQPFMQPYQQVWLPRARVTPQVAPWATAVTEQAPLLSLTIVSTCDACDIPRRFVASSMVKQIVGETWIVHQFRCDQCGSCYQFYSTNAPPTGVFSPHTGMPEFSQPTAHASFGTPRLDALEF